MHLQRIDQYVYIYLAIGIWYMLLHLGPSLFRSNTIHIMAYVAAVYRLWNLLGDTHSD